MGFIHKYIKDRNFVLTLVRDGANNEELEEHVHTLTIEMEGVHPFVELADASELYDLSGFTEVGVAAAGATEFERKPYKGDKLAILISSDEVYNLATNYKATSLYFRYDTKIFRDFRQAIEWLGVADLENEINKLRKE